MDGLEIVHRRLHAQQLSGPRAADPVAAVRQLGAVQAQEFAVAKWSVGQRTVDTSDAVVQQLIDDGAIVRTHVLRPTWHFVAAEDIHWLQALTGPRVHVVNAHYYRLHGLDDDMTARTNAAIVGALRGGNHLTRPELAAALATAGLEATGNRLAYVVIRAELDALIGNGPVRGKQHTYALLSERVPAPVALNHTEALAELTRRYFTSHGPATVKDFAWWSSLTLTQIRRGLDLVGPELVQDKVNGLDFWYAPGEPPIRDRPSTVHILPGYDEYVVAYTESRSLINLAGRTLGTTNENLLVHPIIVDTQMVGHWRREVERGGIVARLTIGAPLTAPKRRAVDQAFARYGDFAGVPVTVVWPD